MDPRAFERPLKPAQYIASIWPIVKALRVQLAIALVSAAALGLGAWLISRYGKSAPWGAVISALGALGVTGSALAANAKKTATGLVERVRAAVAADDRARAATIIPARPKQAKTKAPGRMALPGSYADPVTVQNLAGLRHVQQG